MAAKPKIQWEDFKLMVEQTPAGIAAVAKTMGRSTQQLIKDVQDGKVKTEDFLRQLLRQERINSSQSLQQNIKLLDKQWMV